MSASLHNDNVQKLSKGFAYSQNNKKLNNPPIQLAVVLVVKYWHMPVDVIILTK